MTTRHLSLYLDYCNYEVCCRLASDLYTWIFVTTKFAVDSPVIFVLGFLKIETHWPGGHLFFFGLGEILVIRNHEIGIDPDARDRARVGTEPEQEI